MVSRANRSVWNKIVTNYPPAHYLAPIVVLALPLFALNSATGITGDLRIFIVLVIALVAVAYNWKGIIDTVRRLPRTVSISLLLFVIISIASSVHAGGLTSPSMLIGTASGQFGFGLWLCFFLIGLSAARIARQALFGPLVIYILLLVGVFSLIVGRFDLVHGLRLGGLLYQPTSMAMYACIAVAASCVMLSRQSVARTLRVAAWLVLVVYIAIVIVAQSRIGWLCLLVIIAINGWLLAKKQLAVSIYACLVVVLMLALPFAFHSYFSRYRAESITSGSSYRLDLYKTVSSDVMKHHLILGNGTRALPADLNNRSLVPEDVARTLDQGYIFLSSHNMFLDVAYYFGAVACIALLVIIVYGVRTFVAARETSLEAVNYLLIFGVLLMNSLFNIPSIELTPLFFIVLFGLFRTRLHEAA